MFRTRYIKSLITVAVAAAMFAAACTADPVAPDDSGSTDLTENAEPASLTVDISVDNIGIDVSTRADGGATTGTELTLGEMMDPDHPERMNNEAAFIDGRKMTCLTVILVHRASNRIVGIRRIPDPNCPSKEAPDSINPVQPDPNNAILNDDGTLGEVLRGPDGKPMLDEQKRIEKVVGTKARITFDYNNPVHVVTDEIATAEADKKYVGESAERLVRGEYSIMAVANYDHEVTTSRTGNGDKTLNVDRSLEEIADKFHQPQYMAKGIYPFAPVPADTTLKAYDYLYNIRFLMNYTLKRAADKERYQEYDLAHLANSDGTLLYPYIRPAVHQTLTATKDFYLSAGDNHIDLKLQRISSRTRVEVRNYIPGDLTGYNKDKFVLKVNSLEFSKNYTQSTCYLFRRNKNNRDYTELATKSNRYSDRFYTDHDGKGAPLVTFEGYTNASGTSTTQGAIVPFANNMDSDNDGVNDFVGVPASEKRCVFDALMYESHADYKDEIGDPNVEDDPDAFYYTIDVSYPNITDYKTYDINKVDTEDSNYHIDYDPNKVGFEYVKVTATGAKDHIGNPTTVDALQTIITDLEKGLDASKKESLWFLIKGVGSQRFLYEDKSGGSLLGYDDYEDIYLDRKDIDFRSFLWKLDGLKKESDGNYYCYLKNLRTGKHMSTIWAGVAPTAASHMMSTDDTKSLTYQLGVSDLLVTTENNVTVKRHTGNFYVTFSNTHNNTPYYLSVWANGTYLSGWNENDQGCQYQLFPVKMTQAKLHVGVPRFKKKVLLTAFSDETAVVEEVREIRRNDFVRILVEVSYSPEEGEFNFRVQPWDKRYGAVDFH